RVRWEQPDGGTFVDAAELRAEHLVPGTTAGPVDHERMNPGDDREARAGGGVANQGPATISEPAEGALSGQAKAPHALCTRGEFHAPGRHLEDVRFTGGVGKTELPAGGVGFFHLASVRDFRDNQCRYLAIIFAWPKQQHRAF